MFLSQPVISCRRENKVITMNAICYRICLRPTPGTLGYRGLQRLGPTPRDTEAFDSRFNSACIEYINHGDQLASYEFALDLFRRISESTNGYELICLQSYAVPFNEPRGFLGLDIAQNYWNSLLSWDWNHGPTWQSAQANLIMMRVILDLFAGQLNSNRLFSTGKVAEEFLKAVESLRTICPGTWESPGNEVFEIVAISEIALDSNGDRPIDAECT